MSEPPLTKVATLPRRAGGPALLGGHFVQSPDTFAVEEIPAYLPCGEGEHLYVQIRKQLHTTQEVCEHWQHALSLHPRDVGSAGLKDRKGTTTQWLSFRSATEDQIAAHPLDGVEVLACKPHKNRLKTGHLRGNRFSLVMAFNEAEAALCEAHCAVLAKSGMPNYYGSQRFGRGERNRRDGREILRAAVEGDAGKGKGFRRRLMVSSYQSGLFNDLLAHRIEAELLDTAMVGDMMIKHDSNGQFSCEVVADDQPRMDAMAISPTGWMPGYRAVPATGLQGEWEAAILAREGISAEDFRALGKIAMGTRRPLRAPVADICLSAGEDAFVLSFTLPPGVYASMFLYALGITFK